MDQNDALLSYLRFINNEISESQVVLIIILTVGSNFLRVAMEQSISQK